MCLLTNVIVDIKGRKIIFLLINLFGFFCGGILGCLGNRAWHLHFANLLILIAVNCGFLLAITIQAESLPN